VLSWLASYVTAYAPAPSPEPNRDIRIPIKQPDTGRAEALVDRWLWPVVSVIVFTVLVALFWGALKKHPFWLLGGGAGLMLLFLYWFG